MPPLNLGYNLLASSFKLKGPLTLHCLAIDGSLGELRRDIGLENQTQMGHLLICVPNLSSEVV